MSNKKSKISFDLSPSDPMPGTSVDTPEQDTLSIQFEQEAEAPAFLKTRPEPEPDYDTAGRTDAEPLFDRDEWERELAAPEPAARPAPEPRPVAAMKGNPESVLRAPGFASTGLMAAHEPGFIQRNALSFGIGGGVVATFLLGIATAYMVMDPVGGAPDRTAEGTYAPESFSEAPTRTVISDMTDVSEVSASGPMSTPAISPAGQDLGAAVLAGLQPNVAPVPQPATTQPEQIRKALEALSNNKLRMLREGILAGVYDVETYDRDGVQRVRLITQNAPLTDEGASELLLEAVARGELEMSTSLMNTEGELDIETMMFNIVQTSLVNDHNSTHSNAALDMSRRIFAASNARTELIDGNRTYTVQTGDSLAYIALQFYGRPSAYKRILDANRDTLQSPDQIQQGQRLIIPS